MTDPIFTFDLQYRGPSGRVSDAAIVEWFEAAALDKINEDELGLVIRAVVTGARHLSLVTPTSIRVGVSRTYTGPITGWRIDRSRPARIEAIDPVTVRLAIMRPTCDHAQCFESRCGGSPRVGARRRGVR